MSDRSLLLSFTKDVCVFYQATENTKHWANHTWVLVLSSQWGDTNGCQTCQRGAWPMQNVCFCIWAFLCHRTNVEVCSCVGLSSAVCLGQPDFSAKVETRVMDTPVSACCHGWLRAGCGNKTLHLWQNGQGTALTGASRWIQNSNTNEDSFNLGEWGIK